MEEEQEEEESLGESDTHTHTHTPMCAFAHAQAHACTCAVTCIQGPLDKSVARTHAQRPSRTDRVRGQDLWQTLARRAPGRGSRLTM